MTLLPEDLTQCSRRVLAHLRASYVAGQGFADTGELAQALQVDLPLIAASCRQLQGLGELAIVANRGGDELLVRITEAGMRAVDRADAPRSGSLVQNFHAPVGIVATQVGNHNAMTPQQRSGGTVEEFALLLAQLRAQVATLPEDDQDEATMTIESLDKGVKEGKLARAGRAVETLSKLGAASATFVTSLKTISQTLGLPFPGADS